MPTKTPDIKRNVKNNFLFRFCLVFFVFFLTSSVFSIKRNYYFHDFPDDGSRELAYATESFQEHQLKSIDYRLHSGIPGFLRKSVTNHRLYNQEDGLHLVVGEYKYKWIEGPPMETGDELHFAINGTNKGFFTIQLDSGLIAYTRDGRFRIDYTGRLVTLSGNYPVLGDEGFIIIEEEGDITCTRHGKLYAGSDFVGKLKITIFKSFEEMNVNLHNITSSFFTLDNPIETLNGDQHYNIYHRFIAASNYHEAYDGWLYRGTHRGTMESLYVLIKNRRTLFNALP